MADPSTNGHTPLTEKQRRFVEEYLIDGNASAAYIRAGYRAKNSNVARTNAAILIAKHSVAMAIDEGRAKRTEAAGVTVDWIIDQLKRQVAMPGDGRNASSAQVRALELLGKTQGIFVDRVQVQGGMRMEVVEEVILRHPPLPCDKGFSGDS